MANQCTSSLTIPFYWVSIGLLLFSLPVLSSDGTKTYSTISLTSKPLNVNDEQKYSVTKSFIASMNKKLLANESARKSELKVKKVSVQDIDKRPEAAKQSFVTSKRQDGYSETVAKKGFEQSDSTTSTRTVVAKDAQTKGVDESEEVDETQGGIKGKEDKNKNKNGNKKDSSVYLRKKIEENSGKEKGTNVNGEKNEKTDEGNGSVAKNVDETQKKRTTSRGSIDVNNSDGLNKDDDQLQTDVGNLDVNMNSIKGPNDIPDVEDFHFFYYLLFFIIIGSVLYVVIHNKKKILGLLIEGRKPVGTRRSGVRYRRLSQRDDSDSFSYRDTESSIVY